MAIAMAIAMAEGMAWPGRGPVQVVLPGGMGLGVGWCSHGAKKIDLLNFSLNLNLRVSLVKEVLIMLFGT